MAKLSVYVCECGARKGEGNRWLLGNISHRGFIGVRPWNDQLAEWPAAKHFCGEACFLAWQSKELESMGR